MVHRDGRVGLDHHHGDDEHERGARQTPMLEDGVQPIEEMDGLRPLRRVRRRLRGRDLSGTAAGIS